MTVEIDGANNIVKTNTISEVTSANGVTVDGLNIKDSKLVTADSVVEANITNGAVTSSKIASGVIPSSRPNVNPLIINGDMAMAQRNTSFTSNGYQLDRWSFDESTDGAVTVTQDSTVPSGQGFGKSIKFDVTTADGTLAANQYCQWTQFFEGQNLQLLKYGTSSAENLTLAFWVRSNKTGTYCIRFVKEAGGQTRYECPIEYSISSANTWEKKIINLSPTAGSTTFITNSAGAIVNSNASGYRIAWILASGTDFNSGTNNTWTATSDRLGTTNQVNFLDNTSNELYITGVQLEVGEYTSATIPPFQHESYGANLERCQRYFFKSAIQGEAVLGSGLGNITNGKQSEDWTCALPVTMRALGTVTIYDSTSTTNKLNYYSGGWQSGGTVNAANMQGDTMIHVGSAQVVWNADLFIEAEL